MREKRLGEKRARALVGSSMSHVMEESKGNSKRRAAALVPIAHMLICTTRRLYCKGDGSKGSSAAPQGQFLQDEPADAMALNNLPAIP